MQRPTFKTALAAAAVAALGLAWIAGAGAAQPAGSPLANWRAGTNYRQLPTPQPTAVKKGKVEVNEFFWYGCGHCYALDPALESWKTSKPAHVEFIRTPVVWSAMHAQHARVYYTLQALKRPDLHPVVFDAIHREGQQLASPDEAQARAMHLAFFTQHGITEKDFNAAYDSMAVVSNTNKAQEATQRLMVASVPLLFVNGKYATDVTMAGGQGPLIALINDLAASEKGR